MGYANKLPSDLSAAGFKITNLGAPVSDNDAARKVDLTAVQTSQPVKDAVQYVATLNTARTGNGVPGGGNTQVIAASKRVLCAGETDPVNNGIWVSAAGAWTRATDADAASEIKSGTLVPVDATDAAQPNSMWTCTGAATAVVGVDPLPFARVTFLAFAASVSTQAPGDAAAAGTANTVSRGDHKHQMPATWPPTAHAAAHAPGGADVLAPSLFAALYGAGADGAVALDGIATPVAGATLVGAVYTATRDIYGTTVVLADGVELDLAGFRLHSSGTCTLGVGSIVRSNGGAGTAGAGAVAGAAGAATPAGTVAASAAGAAGRAGDFGGNGIDGAAVTAALGGAGGAGGDANAAHTGGLAGGATALTAAQGSRGVSPWLDALAATQGATSGASAVAIKGGGGGGGGAGGDNNAGTGGGGGGSGAGGGVVLLAVRKLVGDAAAEIQAKGGAGAAGGDAVGAGDGGGGGAGGGGGVALVVTDDGSGYAGTVVVTGGAGGAGGAGTVPGSAGAAGAAGKSAIITPAVAA